MAIAFSRLQNDKYTQLKPIENCRFRICFRSHGIHWGQTTTFNQHF